MPGLREEVGTFLDGYQHDLRENDLDRLVARYSEAFLFAGPQGAVPVKRDDFLRVLPKRREYFRSLGLASSRIQRFDESALDDHYVSVKVFWEMQFDDALQRPALETVATYVLQRRAETLSIVFQLDHQDLAAAVHASGAS